MPGEHNARNAAAALTAIRLAGGDVAAAAERLKTFQGAGRRFERLGHTAEGAEVVDDYAHHPTEVAATIAAARTLAPRRVLACFQPHLYSRTQREATAFGRALAAADLAVILDVYPARERAEDYPGVTGLLVAEATYDAGGGKQVVWARDHTTAERFLRDESGNGDLILTMGAGDVDAVGRTLLSGVRGGSPPVHEGTGGTGSKLCADDLDLEEPEAASASASASRCCPFWPPRAGCGCATRASSPSATSRSPG